MVMVISVFAKRGKRSAARRGRDAMSRIRSGVSVRRQFIYKVVILIYVFYCVLHAFTRPVCAAGNIDMDAAYPLYTIRTVRSGDVATQRRKAYIGAEFIADASRTKIVADGFGYAANAYGAVKLFSLSDGFDSGLDRHLYVIGDDIDLGVSAYDDADLSYATDALSVETERTEITPREYLLMFSGPYRLAEKNACNIPADIGGLAAYADFLSKGYADTLVKLSADNYFIPRVRIYNETEQIMRNDEQPVSAPFRAIYRNAADMRRNIFIVASEVAGVIALIFFWRLIIRYLTYRRKKQA